MKVLLVDDSKVVRVMLTRVLVELGFEVSEAAHGKAGLDLLQKGDSYDLMLVDIHMPEMDGFEFLEAVRAQPNYDGARIMMVTSDTHMDQVSRSLQSGANEYIMKPFTKDALQEKLTLLGISVATNG
ncbi:MAG TPA: response regulator [Nitrospiria bacterium]